MQLTFSRFLKGQAKKSKTKSRVSKQKSKNKPTKTIEKFLKVLDEKEEDMRQKLV